MADKRQFHIKMEHELGDQVVSYAAQSRRSIQSGILYLLEKGLEAEQKNGNYQAPTVHTKSGTGVLGGSSNALVGSDTPEVYLPKNEGAV